MYIFRKRKLHLSTMKHVVKVVESKTMRTMMMNFVTMITTSELRKLSNTSRDLRSYQRASANKGENKMASSVARNCIIDYDATGNVRAITIDGKKYTTGISDIPSNYQAKNVFVA